MRRLTGQAARHAGRFLHFAFGITLLATVVTAAGVAVLAWRLSQGPLEVRWLAHRLEAVARNGGGSTKLTIGSAAIAWQGFRRGVDTPLDIQLANITATDADGLLIADVPRADVALSPEALLTGLLRPRRIEVDGARLRLVRAADGTFRLDLGDFSDDGTAPPPDASPSGLESISKLLKEFARPAGHDGGRLGLSPIAHLTSLRIGGASLVVIDQQLGATWRVPALDMRFDRLARGGLEGHGTARLALGDQQTTLTTNAVLAPGGSSTQLVASLGPVDPAALARSARVLAPLAALAAPVSASLRADLGPQLELNSLLLDASAGAGKATIGASTVRLTGATMELAATPEKLDLRKLWFGLQSRDNGPVSQVQAHGEGRRSPSQFQATLALGLDQVDFADLPALWPDAAGHGARSWVTENITAGTARDAHVEAQLQGPADFSDVSVAGITGTVSADGLTVYWLRPVPPVERARAKLRIVDPDTIEITADAGQQRGEGRSSDPLVIRSGKMKITGINHADQTAAIEADLSGGIAETVALLRQPRLRLLDRHPLPGRDPGGKVSAKLNVQLPLDAKVRIEDVAIRAQAKLTDVHLGSVVAGHDLDQGALDLAVTTEGLKLSGNAQLAGIATALGVDMDFRSGPPSQVLQKITASGRASVRQMVAIGLDPGPALTGAADVDAILTERRNGKGTLQANANLANAELNARPISWHKPLGAPALLVAQATLEHDRFVSLDSLSLDGRDVSMRAQGDFEDGRLSALRFDRLALGQTQAAGTLRFPVPGQGRPIDASFHGPVIDLSAATARRLPHTATARAADNVPSPPWTLEARFERALMASNSTWSDIAARADNDGTRFTRLSVNGQTAPGKPFHLGIAPGPSGRSLNASAADAGALLAGLDLITTMRDGALAVSATFNDRLAEEPLSGTAEITDFRVRDPHGLGKLLQAMTLYGLVQAASGPGLGFNRLTAPFTLTEDTLELGQSRAFNPSLGVTARGRIDLRRSTADIEGTIVPAYFFNSLLGNIPILGRLFSPEEGGGLFAASYAVRGPLDDPQVSVNPLSALTPGFLRGLFGLF